MTAVVVQSRLGSTRLPGKALLPLGGATLTDQVLRRLGQVSVDGLVLATDEESAPELGPIAARNGFELLVGPAEDVLGRYCLAIRRYGIDLVLRATGDNPLVSAELAALLLERRAGAAARGRAPDYAAFVGMPLGMGVELVSARALLKAEAEASLKPEREHVCPYLYDHPEIFAIDRSEAPPAYLISGARITVDTRSDYEAMLRVYGSLYDGKPVRDEALLDYLRAAV
ncbi:MAG: NTP transferase domain-containing protein [Treponema sp.]|nr:NTP transferase domain-containing protein [Treponema sp.]